MTTAKQVMDIAIKEIGYSRWTDSQTGTKYGRWYAASTGSPYYGTNGVPYCAMFVSWCFAQAGDPKGCPGIPGAYCPWIVTAGRNSGQTVPVSQAKYGDVVLFDWGGDGVSDHIGFVENNNGSYLTCIEGNTTGTNGQSGGVNRRTRAYSTVICVIRPKYGQSSSNNTPNNSNNNNTTPQTGSIAQGTYTILVNDLNVRTSPSTKASSVAKYNKNQTVTLDGWSTTADGYVWGRYIGGSSGAYRYIAIKSTDGSKVYASINGQTGSSNSSGVSVSIPAGKYKIIVDSLNVRSVPSTSGATVAKYTKNQTVTLDGYSKVADGYVWGRYTGGSGNLRYIAVRTTSGKEYAQRV